jgi:hypothetical protein
MTDETETTNSTAAGADKLAEIFAYQAAIESAWRWFRRSKKPRIILSEIVERVQAKCPSASPERIKSEIEHRMSRTRHRG